MFVNIGRSAKLISKHILTVRPFFPRVLIPLGVLSFYILSFLWLLPAGVNKTFATMSGKYVVPTTLFLYIVFFAINGLKSVRHQRFRTSGEELSSGDLLLLLLPLALIMQYILNNNDILSLFESILIFCSFALFVSFPILVIPFLLRKTGSARSVMALGLAVVFSITNMASLSHQYAWHETGELKIQVAVFVVVWLVSWLSFRLNFRSFLYFSVVAYFSINLIVQLFGRDGGLSITNLVETDNKLVTLIDSREPVVTPNIYLLVYDAYVVNETMLGYGIDNGTQEQYLESLGFLIYPHTYSIGGDTLNTMSRVLNASVAYNGYGGKEVSGDGIVQNMLGEFGYKNYGVFTSDYFFRGISSSYDYSFPRYLRYYPSASVLFEAILIGEFRFDVGFDRVSREQFVEEKRRIFAEVSEDPRFIYMHSNLPNHSQNSGACLPNEAELYSERLARANLEMRQDVETIIENDPKAIVIVAGDHGPYLTKNCDSTREAYNISEMSRFDLQDRFGTFLAIRWPTADFEEYDDITVLQDLFPVIFAYMFEDPRLLKAKVAPMTLEAYRVSGAVVEKGVIKGGIDDGEPLFAGGGE